MEANHNFYERIIRVTDVLDQIKQLNKMIALPGKNRKMVSCKDNTSRCAPIF